MKAFSSTNTLKKSDFVSNQTVKWCPGCGDYAILAAVQKVCPTLNIPKENFVFVSGIGCSSRFTYYMNTFGFHTIHGRAPSVATGIKIANPQLEVWVISGDGDAFSIGANHFLHTLRRNININYLVLNNQIYGLTKGQYSPTSETGKITKSSPKGSLELPVNPIKLALSSEGTFVARTIDKNIQSMQHIFTEGSKHQGTSFIEVYQNCNIFNDKTFDSYTNRETKNDHIIWLKENEPLIFGKNEDKQIVLNEHLEIKVTSINDQRFPPIIHNSKTNQPLLTYIYSIMTEKEDLPTPFGIFKQSSRTIYDKEINQNLSNQITNDSLQTFLNGNQ